MTSAAQVRANRRNGKRSGGPKTRAGKERASRNSLRHGLAVPIASLPGASAEIDRLATLIAGDGANESRLGLARRIAEAEFDIMRVRRARTLLLGQPVPDVGALQTKTLFRTAMASLDILGIGVDPDAPPRRHLQFDQLGQAEEEAAMLRLLADDLARLDRYERRALSRRKSAIRDLDFLG